MILAFGPINFHVTFDPVLEPVLVDGFVRGFTPPAVLQHFPWPREVHRSLEVLIAPNDEATDDPHYSEDNGELSFYARGVAARHSGLHWTMKLDPRLPPREMMDQATLTLAAVGVATMIEERLGVLLHASTTILDGLAWTFPAPHATGKSTVATLVGPDRLSDDLTVLVPNGDGQWRVADVYAAASGIFPLAGLLFLRRGDRTALGPVLSKSDAIRHEIRNAVLFPGAPSLSLQLLDQLTDIAESVPCRIMDFSLGDLDRDLFRRLICQTT